MVVLNVYVMSLFVYRGVQLIERNEEVAIFYEKVNIQSECQ